MRRNGLERLSDTPFFTVISTARNAGAYARRSIESVLAQTERDWQLIFIDDASNDGKTEECLLAFGDTPLAVVETDTNIGMFCHEPNFIYFRMKQRNWKLANWLLMLPNVDGRILVELDGDDWFATPDALATIRRAYESDSRVEATAGSYFGYPSGSVIHAVRQPARGYRIMQNGFADSTPAPRTWKRHLTERSLREIPDLYIDPTTGLHWQTNADLALFAPALFWAEEIAPIDDVLVNANFESPYHDYLEPNGFQREEGLRLFDALYEREWKLAEPMLRPLRDAGLTT